jgi:gamma-glutamyltranspeptidase/glutathione hydrolase
MRGLLLVLPLVEACGAAPEPACGAVAAPEPRAAQVGADVLGGGGNAVDAAVAVGFALAVTFPEAGNLGGGGFMIVHAGGAQHAVDYRERAPAAASRDMYLQPDGSVHPTRSLYGALAAGVPGTVQGLWTAHRRWGARPWAELLAPAIRLAREGFVPGPQLAGRMAAAARRLEPHGLNFARYFSAEADKLFAQPELAVTLERIARDGPAGFYDGPTAEAIVAQMKRGGGLITREDLASYRAVVREPVSARVGDLRIVSMPPPSSGGVALVQLLKISEATGLPEHGTPAYVHRLAEIEKLVFADRAHWMGDPDHAAVPAAALISDGYARARAALVRPERRSDPAAVRPGAPEAEQTTHFSIVDRWGGAVANTTTLNESFGCGVVVEGAGFLLNNEMDDFSAKPGAPNLFGVTGGAANRIAPGKRMLSSMTPTLVFRGNRLWLVLGTPGGPTIFTSVFQVILHRARYGRPLAEAVAMGRVHHQWPPADGQDVLWVERGREPAPETLAALEAMGYVVRRRGALGDIQAIELGPDGPVPVSDPRGIGRGLRTNP